jgi:ligand-binding sensor domain-containing protein/serine phosphatase RsbU (regulator of sigma subunit)
MIRANNFLLVYLIVLSTSLVGQKNPVRAFSTVDGIPEDYVYNISQDRSGRLVFSSNSRICAFDGITFNRIESNRFNERYISAMLAGEDRIWIGDRLGGIGQIVGDTVRIIHLPAHGAAINQFLKWRNGSVLVATSGGGLLEVVPGGSVKKITSAPLQVLSLCRTLNDEVYAASDEGLFLVEESKSGIGLIRVNTDGTDEIKKITASSHGIWMLRMSGNIALKPRGAAAILDFGDLFKGNAPDNIFCDRDDNLWVNVPGEGVYKLSLNANRTLSLPELVAIPSKNISVIFQDREGNVWLGSGGDGLFMCPAERFRYYDLPVHCEVKSVLPSRGGNLWLGTSAGLCFFNSETKQYKFYSRQQGFSDNGVNALAFDNSGKLWIATVSEGLFVLDTARMKFSQFREERLKAVTVNCLHPRGHEMLAGTAEGIFISDGVNSRWLNTGDGLLHNNVNNLFSDKQARLWIASHGAPVYFLHDGSVTPFKDIKGLESFKINNYAQDRAGRIWIATEGDGVFSFDGTRFVNYNRAHGLFSDFCLGIVPCEDGSLWVVHRNGVSMKSRQAKMFSTFSAQNGFITKESVIHAATNAGGMVWFGSSQGLISYNCSATENDVTNPVVRITKASYNGRELTDGASLKYGRYSFYFGFVSVSLKDPAAIEYRFRLADVDSGWTTTESRHVIFPALAEGSYTFQVHAFNKITGMRSGQPAVFVFKVKKPVWKEVWFYITLFLLLGLIFSVIVGIRTRQMQKGRKILQLKIAQKTFLLQREKAVVERIKEQLENRNKDVTDSINYAKRIQESILPPDELFNEQFGNNWFVLFKPKDIVSGDFYWTAPLNVNDNNKRSLNMAAVLDCTGHGVPGAFLSIMANDLLRQSIVDSKVNNTNEVLDFLNEKVSSHLNQSGSRGKLRDGMDISIVGIDKAERKLYYSGANNPVYIFRKTPDGIREFILPATKQAIGLISEHTRPFALAQFDLMEQDRIYLFSDGFADQFGGEKNKKLNYKRFRALLADSFELPMADQKKYLEDQFIAWKGVGEQTDDVCVMGICFM